MNLKGFLQPFRFCLLAEEDLKGSRKPFRSNGGDSLRDQTLNFVTDVIARIIKISPERIQPETPFEQYGIDSILQLKLIAEFEQVTGELAKTLLFEYATTQELVEYLINNHGDKLLESLSGESARVSSSKALLPPVSSDVGPSFSKATLHSSAKATEDIAIIGISGRYPQANTLKELWEHLKAGHNCIREVPHDRWRTSLRQALSGNTGQQSNRSYYGGFLGQIDCFDYQLFGIPQNRVLELSPELRLFLEVVWETFENAGYTRRALQDLQLRSQNGIGVFVGTMYSQYSWRIPALEYAVRSSNGTDWQIANRTSHFFDLTGPSISVNSACSSSLTAIHLACESLKQQSCAMAIAGGVNLTLDPSKYDTLQEIKFLGSGSQSKSFGSGDGYIPGEGVGAVLLKPLARAIQDHDRIDAVIKSSMINHSGGRQRYRAPDPKQQARLIAGSIQRAGIDPETIGYVESAANGSELGDPIEVLALKNAFREYTNKQRYCALGSVKSNLGHLEAASGISQLSKVLLQLKHRTLVPSINARPQNPNITLDDTAFYLQEHTSPWVPVKSSLTNRQMPRRSMINSFGAGGSYANLIVEEYIENISIHSPSPSEYAGRLLFIFSAKTTWSLIKYLEKMQDFLEDNPAIGMEDVARSLQNINHALGDRAAIIASSNQELREKLQFLQEARRSVVDSDIYTSLDAYSNPNSSSLSIQHAIKTGDIRQLAQFWVTGASIDFRILSGDSEHPRIALPGYAFDHNMTFNFDNSAIHADITDFDDEFYQNLVEKIATGELSENQIEKIIMGS